MNISTFRKIFLRKLQLGKFERHSQVKLSKKNTHKYSGGVLLSILNLLILCASTEVLADSNTLEKLFNQTNEEALPFIEHKPQDLDYSTLTSVNIGSERLSIINSSGNSSELLIGTATTFYDPVTGQTGQLTGRLIVEASASAIAELKQSNFVQVLSYSEQTALALVKPKTAEGLDQLASSIHQLKGVSKIIPEKQLNRYRPL